MRTAVSALTAGQMLALIQSQTKTLEIKVDKIETKIDKEITGMKTRIEVLETEVTAQKEKNDVLSGIVVEMQKALNKVDTEEREKNIMVSGMSETDIVLNEVTLSNDNEKLHKLFELIGADFNPTETLRLGTQKPGKNRVIKVVLEDKNTRNDVTKKASKLKDLEEPWKKIYVNRDEHPVYRSENNRLRKKMNDFRKKPEFQENARERVKIVKGELKADGKTIDKNTFSSFQ